MKAFRRLLPCALLALAAPAAAAPPPTPGGLDPDSCEGTRTPHRLNVVVNGVRSNSGLVVVTLYADEPRRFLAKGGSLGIVRVRAQAPVTRVCMALRSPGHYAVVVYHDADSDRKFDRTLVAPAEDYGLSNDPSTVLGIPEFRNVRFPVHAGDNTVQIRLRAVRKK